MKYDVSTELYEGPLHLLVELAKHNLLDVFLIKLQALTAQYLALVKDGQVTLDDLAEPLPLLGQLVAMKARGLLPQPAPVDEEEVPVSLEELQRRLQEYEQFKNVAQVLAQLHALQHTYLTRTQPQGLEDVLKQAAERGVPVDEAPVARPPKEVGLVDLMTAFSKVLDRAQVTVYEVKQEPWTVEMKVEELKLLVTVRRQVEFKELFAPEKSRLELVVTFLALLELVRQRVCLAVQDQHFGDISIIRRDS